MLAYPYPTLTKGMLVQVWPRRIPLSDPRQRHACTSLAPAYTLIQPSQKASPGEYPFLTHGKQARTIQYSSFP